jgi:hypothetical protein
MRFGFIADELESVVPEVVRSVGNREVADQKAVNYQDMIALLAATAQSLAGTAQTNQKRIDTLAEGIEEVKNKLNSYKAKPAKPVNPVKERNVTNAINATNTTKMSSVGTLMERAVLKELRIKLSAERKAIQELKARVLAAKEAKLAKERSIGWLRFSGPR